MHSQKSLMRSDKNYGLSVCGNRILCNYKYICEPLQLRNRSMIRKPDMRPADMNELEYIFRRQTSRLESKR